ncbi:glycine zipper domain-containing protein [Bartonella queenslandensis]|uniref:glycine zipper domain-containing protein n=1 Tax=Bartonella queenslandensis TaxID=481138 RepID=UPI001BA605E2|nr:glycine zipper domain-containing protein [Bartonella queenslandensis]
MLKSVLKVAVVSAIGFSSVACTTNDERVARYGLGGATIGALAGSAIGGSTAGAVLTGAAFGALAGTVTGEAANQRRQQRQASQLCTYRGRRGHVYQAPCAQRVPVQQLCTYRDARGMMYQAPCPRRVR